MEATAKAVVSARRALVERPESFSLPLGLVGAATAPQLKAMAGTLVFWVAYAEQVPVLAAVRLLQGDYVFQSILRAAAGSPDLEEAA